MHRCFAPPSNGIYKQATVIRLSKTRKSVTRNRNSRGPYDNIPPGGRLPLLFYGARILFILFCVHGGLHSEPYNYMGGKGGLQFYGHELPIETMGPRAPVGEGACQEDPDPEANNRIEGLQKDGRGAAIAFHSKGA
jgi:hypothetical protein